MQTNSTASRFEEHMLESHRSTVEYSLTGTPRGPAGVDESQTTRAGLGLRMWNVALLLFTVILFGVVLFANVACKISFLAIASDALSQRQTIEARNNQSLYLLVPGCQTQCCTTPETVAYEIDFLLLFLVIFIPYAVFFLQSLWRCLSTISGEQPWPTTRATMLLVLQALLEILGIGLFVCVVATREHSQITLILMGCLFTALTLDRIYKHHQLLSHVDAQELHGPHRFQNSGPHVHPRSATARMPPSDNRSAGDLELPLLPSGARGVDEHDGSDSNDTARATTRKIISSKRNRRVFGIALSVQVICTTLLLILSHVSFEEQSIGVPLLAALSIILLSLAWLPQLQKHIRFYVTNEAPSNGMHASRSDKVEQSYQTTGSRANDPSGLQYAAATQNGGPAVGTYKVDLRVKTNLMASSLKLVFMIVFAAAYVGLDPALDSNSMPCALRHLTHTSMYIPLVVNLVTAFIGSVAARLACQLTVQRQAFFLPLALATPVSLWLLLQANLPYINLPSISSTETVLTVVLAVFLWVSELLCMWHVAWRLDTPLLAVSEALFLQPAYNGVFLEQFTLLNRRSQPKAEAWGDVQLAADKELQRSRVFICTTMYREASEEMMQLLQSVINLRKDALGRVTEAHIFMDGGVVNGVLQPFAAQLMTCIRETLKQVIRDDALADGRPVPGDCEIELAVESFMARGNHITTPYGCRFEWSLPLDSLLVDDSGADAGPEQSQRVFANSTRRRTGGEDIRSYNTMPLIVHMKDGQKVKAKKRWSQILYLYYFLQYRWPKDSAAHEGYKAYLLATDADVKFEARDVRALLTLLARSKQVGAACGRTHPIGSGPVVWYQMFDYAVGHWFQKAAEHVFGSVLCCPGCFSMYKFDALRDCLETYGTNVEQPFEVLIKDMGEDRWLCTLMVQAGWRLEYTAAASNFTHCPTDFEEFYNQRRRWIASTFANQVLLLRQWRKATTNNNSVSILFMLYQLFMVASTVLSPVTVIMVVGSGLSFTSHNTIGTIIAAVLASFVPFVLICIFCSKKAQIAAAQVYSIAFAFVMLAVVVSIVTHVASRFRMQPDSILLAVSNTTVSTENSTAPVYAVESADVSGSAVPGWQIDASALYLTTISGIFLVAGLLHPDEFMCLVYGAWYILFLPSGFFCLILYSVNNLNDHAWGTREASEKSVAHTQQPRGNVLQQILLGFGKIETESMSTFFARVLCCRTCGSTAGTPRAESTPPHAQPAVSGSLVLLPAGAADEVPRQNALQHHRSWRFDAANNAIVCGVFVDLLALLQQHPKVMDEQLCALVKEMLLELPQLATTNEQAPEYQSWLQRYEWSSSPACGRFRAIRDDKQWEQLLADMKASLDRIPHGLFLFRCSESANELALELHTKHKHDTSGAYRPLRDFIVQWATCLDCGAVHASVAQPEQAHPKCSVSSEQCKCASSSLFDWQYVEDVLARNGYTDASFLSCLTEQDLQSLGLDRPLYGKALVPVLLRHAKAISIIGDVIPSYIPEGISLWLSALHLECYSQRFRLFGYRENDVPLLYAFSQHDWIQMGIVKPAHCQKLAAATKRLAQLAAGGRTPEPASVVPAAAESMLLLLRRMRTFELTDDSATPSRDRAALSASDATGTVLDVASRLGAVTQGVAPVSTTSTRVEENVEAAPKSVLQVRSIFRNERSFWELMVKDKINARKHLLSNIPDIQGKLSRLRNTALFSVLAANLLWIVLILAVQVIETNSSTSVLGVPEQSSFLPCSARCYCYSF